MQPARKQVHHSLDEHSIRRWLASKESTTNLVLGGHRGESLRVIYIIDLINNLLELNEVRRRLCGEGN